jgi:beta-phosphoglucomutase family hydrolase
MTLKGGVLWDMDGVLVDTGEFHYQAWSQVLPDYGLRMSRELFQSTFGMNNAGVVSTLLGQEPEPELLAELGERKERQFRQVVRGHVRPLPGVCLWLDRLKAEGAPQAIASSAPPANIDVIIDELGLRSYFTAIATGYDLPGKPDPALFLKAARQIDVPPERCVVIEDAVAGVQAAKRAGMRCIAVTTTNPAQSLDSADVVVERLDELPLTALSQLLGEAGAE